MLPRYQKLVYQCLKQEGYHSSFEAQSGLYSKIRCIYTSNQRNEDLNQETKSNMNKPRKFKKSALLNPKVSKTRLKSIENISSIVVSTQKLSCLTMNRHFELTNLICIPFNKFNRTSRHSYYSLLYPLIEFQSKVDLNVIENHVLPPKYDGINLHIKSVVMLLLGMFEQNPDEHRVTFAHRSIVGNIFELNIKRAESRKCSKDLVTEIITNQKWKNRTIYVPPEILVEHDEAIYYTERLNQKLINSRISAETADALIQAIGFWDHTDRILN